MGGGGDGGFGERQDAQDASRANARARLNALFGQFTPGAPVAPVDRSRFTTGATAGGFQTVDSGDGSQTIFVPGASGSFDQAGYDAAVAAAGGSDDAERQAEAERNRTALEGLFGTTRQNAFDAGKRRLDESKGQAGRNLKFELFARGLNGGSTDIDQNALLGRTYSQGLTDLGGKADSVATQLRGDNETARLNLLGSIDSGMDAGSALSSALGQMRTSSDRAASDAIGTNVGDLFSSAGLIYNQNRVAQGRQNANNWWQTQAPSRGGGLTGSNPRGVITQG